MQASLKIIGILFLLLAGYLAAETVLQQSGAAGGAWHYLDDGSNQGTAWKETGFDYAIWSSGNPLLGYGDDDIVTIISYGSDPQSKHITYYFRKEFTVSDASAIAALKLNIMRDDGAVVYLNGTEIVRSNMPTGTITYTTLASEVVDGDNEGYFFGYIVDPSYLVNSTNHLAVEIHQHTQASSDVRFDLQLLAIGARKEPYLLYHGTNTSMQVNWQLYFTHSCSIVWGTNTSYSLGSSATNEYGSDHQHKYTITGLIPGTKYYYKVTVGTEEYAGSFYAAPPSDAEEISFLAYSDTQDNHTIHNTVATQIIADYTSQAKYQTLLVHGGDLVYYGENEDAVDWEFFNNADLQIREMCRHLPIQAIMGNHEFGGSLFDKYWLYPEPSPDPDGSSHQRYWSFDYGPVHFVMLDHYVTADGNAFGNDQLNWLASDLAATSKEWKVAVVHEPGWSAGDPYVNGHWNSGDVQNHLHPLFREYGVDLVLSGHNHYYCRARVDGIYYLTIGSAGGSLYDPDINYAPSLPYLQVVNKSHHFCKFDVSGTILSASIYDSVNENIIDTFIIDYDDPLPVTLSGFSAQYKNEMVLINWITQSETDNAGWNIYRGEAENAWPEDETIIINQSSGLIAGAFTSVQPVHYHFVDPFTVLPERIYYYWLESVSIFGESELFGPETVTIPAPEEEPDIEYRNYGLYQNSPNPFNPSTVISFKLPADALVDLTIYDIRGRKIRTLLSAFAAAGHHVYSLDWDGTADDGSQVASGIYIYKLQEGNFAFSRRLLIIK